MELTKNTVGHAVESDRFPGYFVTPEGKVFSVKRFGPHRFSSHQYKGYAVRKLRVSVLGGKRYLAVSLVRDGKKYRIPVHKLVAECYLPAKPSKGAVVRHLNGNSFDNSYLNLAWGSRQDDANDRILHRTTAKGVQNHFARLSEEIVREIRKRYWSGESTTRIAEQFCLSQRHVRNIAFGRCWRHV
jgi:hypothetical protein